MILVPGAGQDVLVELINQNNALPYPLPSEDAFISVPVVIEGPDPTLVEVKVVPMPGTLYEGAVPVRYNRMDLSSAFGDMRPGVTGLSEGSLSSILPTISKALGIDLRAEDFEELDYSWLGVNESANLMVRALPSSRSYIGEFVVQFTRRRLQLDEVILNKALDVIHVPGYTVAGKAFNKRQVDMVTWSTDFTEYYADIQKHFYYNRFRYGSRVRTLMSNLFGFVNWPVNYLDYVYDLPTSEVPEANQDFDRVITQKIVDRTSDGSWPYEGTAYFHYNVV